MKPRRPFARRLFEAWQLTVREDYAHRRINSERSLQASLWSQLVSLLPDTQSVFIEPTFRVPSKGGSRKVIPDLVV